jgi:hypothetical protein
MNNDLLDLQIGTFFDVFLKKNVIQFMVKGFPHVGELYSK